MAASSPILGRLLALAILVAVVAGAYEFVFAPLSGRFTEYRESIAQSRELYVKYQRIAAGQPQLETQLDALKRRERAEGGYLEGASETLAAAGLQNRLKGLFARSGGALKSLQILPAKPEEAFLRITVRAQLSADTNALRQILHALEADTPFLFVENVDLRKKKQRRRRRRRRQQEAAPVFDPGVLEVRFDVYSYMRAPAT